MLGLGFSLFGGGRYKYSNDCWHFDLTRAAILSLQGIHGQQQDFILWLLAQCVPDKMPPTDLLSEEAIALLGDRLRTLLQIEQYLNAALEEAYKAGQRPVGLEIVE